MKKQKTDTQSYVKPDINETFEDFKLRVYDLKLSDKLNMTWSEISNLFAMEYGIYKGESTWRKEATSIKQQCEMLDKKESDDTSLSEMHDLILQFKKEKVKISDERSQNNAFIRRLAREDTIKEIALQTAREMYSKKLLDTSKCIKNKDVSNVNKEAIIQISDWHYGIEIDNFVNRFDPDECIKRVQLLLQHCREYFEENKVKKIHVVNLGDLIAGRIHGTIRLQSRYDVITQTMHVAEILAEFLIGLSEIAPIEYYDCLDNHSRLEPNKEQHLDLESLTRIIPWYLKYRLENTNITINTNTIDEDIISFKVMDKFTVGGVHGHKDKPSKVVDNLTLLTKINFDLLLTAHLHHFSSDEKNETIVVSNGSLMGTDKYAFDLRLSATPSQNIIVVNEKSVVDDIHRVVLV